MRKPRCIHLVLKLVSEMRVVHATRRMVASLFASTRNILAERWGILAEWLLVHVEIAVQPVTQY